MRCRPVTARRYDDIDLYWLATPIRTLEPYVPSLHRNPDNDRFRLALFLYLADGRSPGRPKRARSPM